MTKAAEDAKRKYRKLTDREILELVRSGRFQVCVDSQNVYSTPRQGVRRPILPRPDKEGYLHVRLYHANARKSISLGRLIFMVHHNRLIKRGMDIDHFPDRTYTNNHPDNLRERPFAENRADILREYGEF